MSLVELLSNPVVLVGGAAIAGVAIMLVYLRRGGELSGVSGGGSSGPSKKYVILLRPKDHRMKFIKIVDESDESLQGPKEKTGRTRYFVKREAGWSDEDHPQTMWLGLNAYAYTLKILNKAEETISLALAVKTVLGDAVYAVIAPEFRQKLEAAELGMTLGKEDIENPALIAGLSVGNESRHTESDQMMIDYYAKKNADAMKKKTDMMTIAMGVAIGIIIGVMLVNFKVIHLA